MRRGRRPWRWSPCAERHGELVAQSSLSRPAVRCCHSAAACSSGVAPGRRTRRRSCASRSQWRVSWKPRGVSSARAASNHASTCAILVGMVRMRPGEAHQVSEGFFAARDAHLARHGLQFGGGLAGLDDVGLVGQAARAGCRTRRCGGVGSGRSRARSSPRAWPAASGAGWRRAWIRRPGCRASRRPACSGRPRSPSRCGAAPAWACGSTTMSMGMPCLSAQATGGVAPASQRRSVSVRSAAAGAPWEARSRAANARTESGSGGHERLLGSGRIALLLARLAAGRQRALQQRARLVRRRVGLQQVAGVLEETVGQRVHDLRMGATLALQQRRAWTRRPAPCAASWRARGSAGRSWARDPPPSPAVRRRGVR